MTTKTRRSGTTRRTPEERRAQAEALHEQLTAQVATLAESENWKAWLRFARIVRRRSFSNQMLILAQGGTHCLGYRQWETLGRHVVKGAKSIKIFGYSTKRIVEVDEALLGQQQDRGGRELLRRRADVHDRVGRHRFARIEPRRTERLRVHDRAVAAHGDGAARVVGAQVGEPRPRRLDRRRIGRVGHGGRADHVGRAGRAADVGAVVVAARDHACEQSGADETPAHAAHRDRPAPAAQPATTRTPRRRVILPHPATAPG